MGKYREPQSANEAALQNLLGEQNELREPQSPVEFYLQELIEQGGGGGSGEGLPVFTIETYEEVSNCKITDENEYLKNGNIGVIVIATSTVVNESALLVILGNKGGGAISGKYRDVVLIDWKGKIFRIRLYEIDENIYVFKQWDYDDLEYKLCNVYYLPSDRNVIPSYPDVSAGSTGNKILYTDDNGNTAQWALLPSILNAQEDIKYGNKVVDLNAKSMGSGTIGQQVVSLISSTILMLASTTETSIGVDYGAQGASLMSFLLGDLFTNLKDGKDTIVKYGTYTSQVAVTDYIEPHEDSPDHYDQGHLSCMFTNRQIDNNTLYDVDVIFDVDLVSGTCFVVGHGKKTAITFMPMS